MGRCSYQPNREIVWWLLGPECMNVSLGGVGASCQLPDYLSQSDSVLGLVVGGGIFRILPTNTDDDLSKDLWQFGPDVILAYVQKWGVIGAIITHVWDVAGDDDTDTSLTSINYLYAFGIGNGWQIASGPTISIDWDANRDDRLTLPIGFGVSKTTRIGNTPLKLALDINKTLVGPDTFGQDWLIKLTVTPVIKLPWGKK